MTDHVLIIAEAGVNHNGSLALAKRLVDAAKDAGADAVKFQTFSPNRLATAQAPKADYQRRATGRQGSQLDMLTSLALSESDFRVLQAHCRRRGILFLSSAFDLPSVDFLAKLRLPFFKIPSGEITNLPYLKKIGTLRKKVLLSTGMSTLKEVRAAVDVLVQSGTPPGHITVLHCTSQYPASFAEANLRVLPLLAKVCGTTVGYSDHTPGFEAAAAAVALGARVIEKHLTLDTRMKGPDHAASLDPQGFERLVHVVRRVETALGSAVKRPSLGESANRRAVRKSLVAARAIRKGERFTANNLAVKRPGTGINPMRWDAVIGRRANRDYAIDEMICL